MARPIGNHNQSTTPLELTIPTIPEGFILLQDTREQMGLFSDDRPSKDDFWFYKDKVPVRSVTLPEGDYSIHGYESEVCIELKRWSDFMSYAGKERQSKTIPKLERMSKMSYAELVVIEDYANLIYPQMYGFGTQLTTMQVRGFLKSLVRYGVGFFANASEDMCRMWVLDRLVYWYIKRQAGEI